MLGGRLDLMILEVSSNLNDSTSLNMCILVGDLFVFEKHLYRFS